jgi:outer membrane protein insertion porin family
MVEGVHFLRATTLILLLLGWCGFAFAEAPHRTIASIEIEAFSPTEVQKLLELVGVEEGEVLSTSRLRRAVKLLYQLGRFANVYVYEASVSASSVNLRFVLPPRPILNEIRLLRSEELSRLDIEDALGLTSGRDLFFETLPAMRKKLATMLALEGYRKAAVGVALDPVDPQGKSDLLIRIDEGPRTIIRRLNFVGSALFPKWKISESLGLTEGGPLHLRDFEKAKERLRDMYVRRGHFDVRIESPEVKDIDGGPPGLAWADVSVHIDAGPKVIVQYEGHLGVPFSELEEATEGVRQRGTDRVNLVEAKDQILSLYRQRGFYRASVRVDTRMQNAGSVKLVRFTVRQGKKPRVARISFAGNRAIGDDVLRKLVLATVKKSLEERLDRPGADPAVIDAALGDHSSGRPRSHYPASSLPPDPDSDFIERAYRSAVQDISDLFRQDGFQSMRVVGPEVRERSGGQLVDVSYVIEEGTRWLVHSMRLRGNEVLDSGSLFKAAGQEQGVQDRPLSFYEIEETRRSLLTAYRNEGFLYASVQDELRDVVTLTEEGLKPSSSEGLGDAELFPSCRTGPDSQAPRCYLDLVFAIKEGPRVRARKILIQGLEGTREQVVRDQFVIQQGEILRQDDIEETRENLLRMGVFDRVAVRLFDDEVPEAEKDVVVDLRERKYLSLELGAGASSEQGLRLFGVYSDANLFGSALRFQLSGKLNVQLPIFFRLYSTQIREAVEAFYATFSPLEWLEYELAAGVTYPRIFDLPPGFSAGMDAIVFRDNEPSFVENGRVLRLVGTYKGFQPTVGGEQRPLIVQLRANFDWSKLLCNDAIQDRQDLCSVQPGTGGDRIEGSNVYLSLGPRLSLDLREPRLDPESGFYFELDSQFSKSLQTGSADYVFLEGRANAYVRILPRVVFAFSLLVGKLFSLDTNEQIPVNRRLFAGGRSTIRGYPEKSLFPQDIELDENGQAITQLPTGGELRVAAKSELRVRVWGGLSLAGFFDIGDLFESGRFSFSTVQFINGQEIRRSLAQGAGVGFRYGTPVGPLTLDFAFPVNPRGDPGEVDWTLHFSVRSF